MSIFGNSKLNKFVAGISIVLVIFTTLVSFIPNVAHAGTIDDLNNSFKINQSIYGCAAAQVASWLPGVDDSKGIICMVNFVVATIVNVILSIVGLVLRLCAFIFDSVLKYAVLDFAAWGHNAALLQGWRIFRDTGNVFFIFVLLYAAIGTILGLHSVDAKKMVVRILIVALLVNFSGVFTRVMIDASNSLAVHFYQKSTNSNCDLGDTASNCTLGASVMNTLHTVTLSGLADQSSTEGWGSVLNVGNRFFQLLVSAFGGIVFILLTSFILLAAALFFAVRAVKLLFLIMTSPVAYIASIIPSYGGKISSMWWDTIAKELVFAPAFFLLFSITLDIGKSGGEALGTGASGPGIFMQTLVFFIFLIGLMFGCLMIASSLGAAGASAAQKFGNKIATGMAIGAGAYLGTRTAGRLSAKIANSDFIRRNAKKSGMAGFAGRLALQGADKGADFGFGGKKGYVSGVKETAEAHVKLAERLDKDTRTGDKAKVAKMVEKKDAAGNVIRDSRGNAVMEEAKDAAGNVIMENSNYGDQYIRDLSRPRIIANPILRTAANVATLGAFSIPNTENAHVTQIAQHEFGEKKTNKENKKRALQKLKDRLDRVNRELNRVPPPVGKELLDLEDRRDEIESNIAKMEAEEYASSHGAGGHPPPPAAPAPAAPAHSPTPAASSSGHHP